MRITYETNFVATVEVSEVKHYTQLIKTGIPPCMKGTSFEVLMR